MREEYNGRRRYLIHRFQEMGLTCFEPFGAFYAFPCIKEFGMSSDEFATRMLQEEKVVVDSRILAGGGSAHYGILVNF